MNCGHPRLRAQAFERYHQIGDHAPDVGHQGPVRVRLSARRYERGTKKPFSRSRLFCRLLPLRPTRGGVTGAGPPPSQLSLTAGEEWVEACRRYCR
jgi:hypothetical protein